MSFCISPLMHSQALHCVSLRPDWDGLQFSMIMQSRNIRIPKVWGCWLAASSFTSQKGVYFCLSNILAVREMKLPLPHSILTCAGLRLPSLVGAELQIFRLLGQHGSWTNLNWSKVHAGPLDADAHTWAPVWPLHQVAFTCSGAETKHISANMKKL